MMGDGAGAPYLPATGTIVKARITDRVLLAERAHAFPRMVLDVRAARWILLGVAAFTFYRMVSGGSRCEPDFDAICVIFEILGNVLRHSGERSSKIVHKSYCFLDYCMVVSISHNILYQLSLLV